MMKDDYTITMMNLKKSALVRRSEKRHGFIIQTLEEGASKFIADISLKDCKTMQSFLTRFAKNFNSKRLLLSIDSNSKIVEMLSESESTETETENDTNIPYSVVDLNNLLLVSKSKNGFEIESVSTGLDKFLPDANLFGNYYKYTYDFARSFSENIFSSLDGISIIISEEAYNSMVAIMAFNRIDC